MAVKKGVCHMAGSHLLDTEDGSYNIRYLEKYLPDMDVRLVNLVFRDQGFIVPKGNPKKINGIEDICREDIRFIRRKKDKIDFFANSIGLKVYPGTRLEKQVKAKKLMADDFSWARYNPPLKNLMFLEPADVFILEQKQLSYLKLFWIGVQLHLQRTNLSPGFMAKMMWNNLKSIIDMLVCQVRYYRHNAARKLGRFYNPKV